MDDRKRGSYLIGKDSWKDWPPFLTYFACIGTFVLNRRDEDHIVYKNDRVVRKEAKKLMMIVAREAAREGKFHLKTRGQLNLGVVPEISDCYEIIVNVWSEKTKRKIKTDSRNITKFNFERPQLDIIRTESGRFCIITKMGRFLARQMCDDCLKPFTSRKTLWNHKKQKRCPYERFVGRLPEGNREQFFETAMEEYMIERSFPRGRIKPHRTIEERLEDLHIYIPPNFILKQYFCVSDIESFLRPLPHKYVEGEEAHIYGDKLEGLMYTDVHKPCAISAVSNLGEQYSASECFINMDGSSNFIGEYCRYLYEMADCQYEMLQHQHEIVYEQLTCREKEYEDRGADLWLLTNIRKLRKDLQECSKKLVVYFFNASYDLNCLIRHGLCWFLQKIDEEQAEKANMEQAEVDQERQKGEKGKWIMKTKKKRRRKIWMSNRQLKKL